MFCSLKSNLFQCLEFKDCYVGRTFLNGNLKVHISQFYVNENGETKAGRIGNTLSVEEFNELVKLIPQFQDNIVRYKFGILEYQLRLLFPKQNQFFLIRIRIRIRISYHRHHLKVLLLPFEVRDSWTVFPNLHYYPCPFPIYDCFLIVLWKRFCLILVQKKYSRDIIKTLPLMKICMAQQSMKKHELLT